MTTTKVTRDQFDDTGELAVTHRPTGQRFSTYRYENPDDMSQVNVSGAQNERDEQGNEYDGGEISDMAFALLQDKLRRGR